MENLIYNFLPRIENLGSLTYGIVFLVGILESLPVVSLVIPSGIILILFGFLASEGTLHMADLVWAASIGAVMGDSFGYYLGRYKGKFASKISSKLFNQNYLTNTSKFFEDHGGKSIFIGRFVGILRPFLGLVAGMHGMKYPRFLVFNITSGFIWSSLYIFLGYYFGDHLKKVIAWLNVSNYIILIILVIVTSLFVWRKLKSKDIISPL